MGFPNGGGGVTPDVVKVGVDNLSGFVKLRAVNNGGKVLILEQFSANQSDDVFQYRANGGGGDPIVKIKGDGQLHIRGQNPADECFIVQKHATQTKNIVEIKHGDADNDYHVAIRAAGQIEALEGVILKSANGTLYKLVVSDAGALSTVVA
jgi:hypothetical protein